MNESQIKNDNNSEFGSEIILQGRFIIQKIFEMEMSVDLHLDEMLSILNENLPKFKRGTEAQPGLGFRIFQQNDPTERISSDEILLNIFNSLIIIEFQKEKYEKRIDRYEKGVPVYKKFPKLITNHIFIVFPKYVIFKGSKENLELIESSFFRIMKDKVNKNKKISFDPDFILWTIMKFRKKEFMLDDNFRLHNFSDLSTTGFGEDYIGRLISTKKSRDVTKSVPMLLTILSGREPKDCKFAFIIDGYAGTVQIRSDGTLAILHSLGIFNLIPPIEKIVISIHYIIRLVNLYKKWLKLNPKERYPTEEDLLNIVKDCKELGMRIYDISGIINRYKEKLK